MKDKFDIVSGNFEGNFYTHQKTILTATEFNPNDKKYDIHLYRGELSQIKKEEEYNPEQLRNRESFLLHNVTNVQFHLEKDAEGNSSNRIYNFEQLLLRDAVIKESWEINGKTYGIITGKLLGKVKDEVKSPDPTNPEVPLKPTPKPTPKPKPEPDSSDPIPTGGGNGLKPKRFWEDWWKPKNPDTLNGGSGGLNIGNGCLPRISGCLSNIWRLLLALLLLLFILWFLKGCWDKKEKIQNCCGERDSLEITNKKNQIILDSLNNEIIKRDSLVRECQNEQKKNQELEERRRSRNGRVGEVTVTLMWDSEDDIDLSIIEPSSEIIWYGHKNSNAGGFHDIDDNANQPFSKEPIENIRWLKNAPQGNYDVKVKLYKKRSELLEIPFYLEIKTNENVETYDGVFINEGENVNYNFNFTKLTENQ
jgi:hypothetical protein